MEIIGNINDLATIPRPTVVTLGNFDGVHLGHRELFRRLVCTARKLNAVSVVYTFEPHPLKVVAPKKAPLLLNTPGEKVRLIAASHVDYLVKAPFTRDLANQSAEQFVIGTLQEKLGVQCLIVGYDYAFGKGREGNAEYLQEMGARLGFRVEVLKPVGSDGVPYSSTRIREWLSKGQVAETVSLLGRHYNLEGVVVPGEQRGRSLGFPTANLQTDKEQLPASGVYAVKVRHKNQEYNGVVNLGCRPTFGGNLATIEVHLLDFSGDLYGDRLRIYFVERLRGEKNFADATELGRAIANDVLRSRQLLETARIIQFREYLGDLKNYQPSGEQP